MAGDVTIIAELPIPSTSPLFLAGVGFHVLAGLVCVATGAVAMLSRKGRGRHSSCGTAYFWSLVAVFISATTLATARWSEDYPLFFLGVLAMTSAYAGRAAARLSRAGWVRWHIAGMGASYIFLLTAFYVDNGRNLPLWRALPQVAFWLLPAAVGAPIIAYALLRHRLVRHPPGVLRATAGFEIRR